MSDNNDELLYSDYNKRRMLTRSLFLETVHRGYPTNKVKYILEDRDHPEFPSLYRLYMAESDPTEYNFANKYFDSYEHWLEICKSPVVAPYVEKMRRDLKLKLQSEALARLVEIAKKDDLSPTSLAANKYILSSFGFDKTEGIKRGRPTKAQVAEEAQRLAANKFQATNDFERLGLKHEDDPGNITKYHEREKRVVGSDKTN